MQTQLRSITIILNGVCVVLNVYTKKTTCCQVKTGIKKPAIKTGKEGMIYRLNNDHNPKDSYIQKPTDDR